MRLNLVPRLLGVLIIVVGSVGWLVPTYAAAHYYVGYLEEVVDLRLKGLEPMTKFDFLLPMQQMIWLAVAWLAVVIVCWSSVGAWKLLRPEAKP
jgi:hypothetical protein